MRITEAAREGNLVDVVEAARRGLSEEETMGLAVVLAESGARLQPDPSSASVSSTGGPTSLSTLVCPLQLRLRGFKVPALGVPGRPAGGVDVLGTIPGYKPWLNEAEARRSLDEYGSFHMAAGDEWTPLDQQLFRFRQSVGAQDVRDLVVASILSKTLAVGAVNAGLEVRVAPYGNFGADASRATENARRFVAVAGRLGISATCLLTDGTRPYQPYVGRGEALVALSEILSDAPGPWLRSHVDLCRSLSALVAERTTEGAFAASTLSEAFDDLLSAQATNRDAFDERVADVRRTSREPVVTHRDGFIEFDLALMRSLLVDAQRQAESNSNLGFSDPAGIVLVVTPGSYVERGTEVMSIRVASSGQSLRDRLRTCINVSDQPAGVAFAGPIEVF